MAKPSFVNGRTLFPQLLFFLCIMGFSPVTIVGQEEGEEGIFWDEDTLYYGEEDTLYYGEEDTLYYEGEEYGAEEDTIGYGEEGFEEEGFSEEEGTYIYGGAGEEEDQLTDLEFAEEARRQGFSILVTAASPRYVNHTLTTWNSLIDYRVSIDFPFLMEIGRTKFRFGIEIVTFSFENYLPVGGKFSGVGGLAVVSFPAGPGTVRLGAGRLGSSPAVVAGQSYGLSLGNVIDLRIGIRSTTVYNLPNVFEEGSKSASWLDGFITVGYTL